MQELNEPFLKIREDDYTSFILFYEKHKNSIDKIEIDKSEDVFYFKLKVIGNYGRALFSTKSFKKAITPLKTAILMLEHAEKHHFKNKKLTSISYYEFLLFLYAQSYYCIKDYKSSRYQFQKLAKLFPLNTSYKNWLQHSTYYSIQWVFNLVFILVVLLIISDSFILSNDSSILSTLGISLGVIAILTQWVWKKGLKQKQVV